MRLFTVGPVNEHEQIKKLRAEQSVFPRTKTFTIQMKRIEELLIKFLYAASGSKVLPISCSGSGAMEATVSSLFDKNDKLLILNSGTFGERFVVIAERYNIPYDVLVPEDLRKSPTQKDLDKFKDNDYTGILINNNETSIGVLNNLELFSRFAKEKNALLVCDAISSFLADEFNMEKLGADIAIITSQKGLGASPGVAFVVASPKAIEKMHKVTPPTLYFDLNLILKHMENGQTPFTPASGIFIEILNRLEEIDKKGVESEIEGCATLAKDLRERMKSLDKYFHMYAIEPSNCVTCFEYSGDTIQLFEYLMDNYGIVLHPAYGTSSKHIRAGHLGNLTIEDNIYLVESLESCMKAMKSGL